MSLQWVRWVIARVQVSRRKAPHSEHNKLTKEAGESRKASVWYSENRDPDRRTMCGWQLSNLCCRQEFEGHSGALGAVSRAC